MPCVMLRPWFRGGCHACFCRPDGWVPSVLVLCKHEVSPWLPKRTARSAPASFSPPSRKLPPVAAQKFQTAYHLIFDCEQLQTPLLATTTALTELCVVPHSPLQVTARAFCGEPSRALSPSWLVSVHSAGSWSVITTSPPSPPPELHCCQFRFVRLCLSPVLVACAESSVSAACTVSCVASHAPISLATVGYVDAPRGRIGCRCCLLHPPQYFESTCAPP